MEENTFRYAAVPTLPLSGGKLNTVIATLFSSSASPLAWTGRPARRPSARAPFPPPPSPSGRAPPRR
ncbi:unnamed protein product [Spirodela intermedia]|uniref:Uncharacterized protein n=1 Tax=Spirodela intermedia TaxID=51605 RepID=A0A7I8JFN1_SPIIN|nr:unnamed protein product [Spirodela intermedia]CAA6668966.1 unnamed protein product [Spirodela intermedia]